MIKVIKERTDWSLDKLSTALENPPQDVFVLVYTKRKIEVEPVDDPSERVNLKQVVKMMNDNFKRLDSKMDAGFKQVNERIDNIEKRLDYNNLKPLPNHK